MTQIGEAIAAFFGFGPPPSGPGSLTVIVKERSSEEAIEQVKVSISGTSSASATTDSAGQAVFSGLPAGTYRVQVEQPEFEMSPAVSTVAVEAGGQERLELEVRRVMLTLLIKRIHIAGLWKAAGGDKSDIEYGHWWIEIDGSESYGWWPGAQVTISGTFKGVPGALNGVPYFSAGTGTTDPHHGDPAEEMFHPAVRSGQPAATIKDCIRSFAKSYSGTWSWPWGQNCHSFQEAMMEHCKLSKSGSKKEPNP